MRVELLSPPKSLIKAGEAGDITATDSYGLELCCHRIVVQF